MTNQDILSILSLHYQIPSAELKQLDGYESLNYKVSIPTGKKYVLKIHTHVFEHKEILMAENEIMLLLGKKMPGYFARPIPNVRGELISHDEQTGYEIRLLDFLEGTFLGETEITVQHLSELGKNLGKIDRILSEHYNTAIAARVLKWDLQHCLTRREFSSYIKDAKKRHQVDYLFLQYQERVLPFFPHLRKSIIHGDANDWNVLETNGHISGFIDFGDMAFTPTINELAIAIPYSIFGSKNPIADASIIIRAYHQQYPLEVIELELLYYLIGARLATSASHSAFFNRQKPDDEYITISEKPVWNLIDQWLSINPIHVANCFKKACGYAIKKQVSIERDIAQRHRYISPSMSLSYRQPIKMSGAAFQYMYSATGATFLDAYNNIPIVGHCHPKVVAAGQRQMARLNTNTRYIYDSLHEYSEKLLSHFPKQLHKVFFVNSGSAASDLAIRMAHIYTERQYLAVLEHGYHGNTLAGITASSYKFDGKGGKGVANHIIKLPMPDDFRGKFKRSHENPGYAYAQEAIAILKQKNHPIAAFIAEPIMGCGGQIVLPKDYLKEMFAYTKSQGGLCIADEVQIGFARVGTHFWGFQQHDVIPDIVILGKPIGNGHPMAAVVCTNEVAAAFENGMEFFSSFGGNPVSCEIGKAVLEVIEEEKLQEHSLEVGSYIIQELRKLQKDYAVIGDVRGSGLFWGMEMVQDNVPNTRIAQELKNYLKNQHILISTDGPYDNVLKSKPPLCFNMDNASQLLEGIQKFLQNH